MDARGHGKSDKPHEPAAYTMYERAGDVTAVLDDLGIEKCNFFGYSYGGRVAFELGKCTPSRVNSLIIGGCGAGSPPTQWYEGMIGQFQKGSKFIIESFEKAGPLNPGIKARLMANDTDAFIAILKQPWVDLSNELINMKMPCLLFGGEADFALQGVIASSKVFPHAKLVSFPNLDHIQANARVDLVIPMLKEFLAQVSKA
jgi:pimeloyl-ACP methyl ester carboxylesterase